MFKSVRFNSDWGRYSHLFRPPGIENLINLAKFPSRFVQNLLERIYCVLSRIVAIHHLQKRKQ